MVKSLRSHFPWIPVPQIFVLVQLITVNGLKRRSQESHTGAMVPHFLRRFIEHHSLALKSGARVQNLPSSRSESSAEPT